MVGARAGLVNSQGALVHGAGAVEVALVMQDFPEFVEASGGLGMFGAQPGLPDGEGALVEAAGVVEVTLVGQDMGEVAEAGGGVGVVGAQAGLADRKAALAQGAGLRVSPPAPQVAGRTIQQVAGLEWLGLVLPGMAGSGQRVGKQAGARRPHARIGIPAHGERCGEQPHRYSRPGGCGPPG
jgi:hypothetical protein